MTAAHAAVGDCEALATSVLGGWQPVNTVSSLAFVAAGLWLVRDPGERTAAQRRVAIGVGGALVAVGLGSVAFHGPGSPAARWVHDVALAALLLAVAASDVGDLRGDEQALVLAPAALAAVGGVLLLAPSASVPLAAGLASGVVVTEALVAVRGLAPGRFRSRPYLLGLGALVAGAVVDAASGTGAPWCRPEALLQGHAVWHVAAAAAVTGWVAAVRRHPARTPSRP